MIKKNHYRVRLLSTLLILLLLQLAPVPARSAGNCDAVGKELDSIAEQIAALVKQCEMTEKNPCEGYNYHPTPDTGDDENYGQKYQCVDTRQSPCSKDEWASISEKIKSLTENANALSQQCFGVPYGGGR